MRGGMDERGDGEIGGWIILSTGYYASNVLLMTSTG